MAEAMFIRAGEHREHAGIKELGPLLSVLESGNHSAYKNSRHSIWDSTCSLN